MKHFYCLLLIFFNLAFAHQSSADALLVNKAMQASSIAEFSIDGQGVTVELEITERAIKDFKDLLPDRVYQSTGFGEQQQSERLANFFSQQLLLMDEQEKILKGQLLSIAPAKRILRDPINGTPLPIQDAAPDVVHATLYYPFNNERPQKLIFISPPVRDIGFIAYHNGVAVNDFRYLSSGLTLNLDWHDPWYSRFDTRNMKRQYSAPMSGFIYVEPFEVRKEIIVRPKDLQRWIDLGLEGKQVIPVERQGEIKEIVANFLAEHHPVTIDGVASKGILESVNFLERTLTSSRVIDPPQPLSVDSAIIGTIFIYPRSGQLPNKVIMDWDLWDERIQKVPVSAVDQAGPLPSFLEPDWNQLIWENFLKNPDIPTLAAIQAPATRWQVLLYKSQTLFLLATLISFIVLGLRARQLRSLNTAAIAAAFCAGLTVMSFSFGISNQPNQQRAEAIIGKLLHNVYRAFDYREESDVYDMLDRSVTGELLTDIYLETKRSLVLSYQGGARAKVKEVTLESISLKAPENNNSFSVEARWIVGGSVGHWGHIHQRYNRYHALLTISVVEDQWKLNKMSVLQEERL